MTPILGTATAGTAFDATDTVESLVTFTPAGGASIPLGVDDCYIEVRHDDNADRFTVHAQYVVREGSNSQIIGGTRAKAETYARNLALALGVTKMSEIPTNRGSVLIPASNAVAGTLQNPYTLLSVTGLYCTEVTHEDDGGRGYVIVVTFVRPMYNADAVDPFEAKAWFKYGATALGNLPGKIDSSVDAHFQRYTINTAYRLAAGVDPITYVNALADTLNLTDVHEHAIARGVDAGKRGVIKTYNQADPPPVLHCEERSLDLALCYLKSIDSTENDQGIMLLTFNFVKGR